LSYRINVPKPWTNRGIKRLYQLIAQIEHTITLGYNKLQAKLKWSARLCIAAYTFVRRMKDGQPSMLRNPQQTKLNANFQGDIFFRRPTENQGWFSIPRFVV
jgi:hypothetical protein